MRIVVILRRKLLWPTKSIANLVILRAIHRSKLVIKLDVTSIELLTTLDGCYCVLPCVRVLSVFFLVRSVGERAKDWLEVRLGQYLVLSELIEGESSPFGATVRLLLCDSLSTHGLVFSVVLIHMAVPLNVPIIR
jgi:hypothetical protein